jgi:hypothetical protein
LIAGWLSLVVACVTPVLCLRRPCQGQANFGETAVGGFLSSSPSSGSPRWSRQPATGAAGPSGGAGLLVLSRGDSWDASRQIARPLACPISHPHDTSPQNWRSLMGLHGASAGSFPCRSLVRFHRSPRILCLAWRLLVSRPSLVEFHRPSRDVPALSPIRLATAKRPRAGTLLLWNLCCFGF